MTDSLYAFFVVNLKSPQPGYFPATNRTEALLLTWVTKVATLLPDWALQSLDAIIKDPEFQPGDCRGLLTLRDLKVGPLRHIPRIEVSTRTTPSGSLKLATITSVVRQAFGIPQVT